MGARNQLLGMAAQNPNLMAVRLTVRKTRRSSRSSVGQAGRKPSVTSLADINSTINDGLGQLLCQ